MSPQYLMQPEQFNRGAPAPVPYDRLMEQPDLVSQVMGAGALPQDEYDEDGNPLDVIPAEEALLTGQRIAAALHPYKSIYAGVPTDPLINVAEIDRRKRRTRSIYGLIF